MDIYLATKNLIWVADIVGEHCTWLNRYRAEKSSSSTNSDVLMLSLTCKIRFWLLQVDIWFHTNKQKEEGTERYIYNSMSSGLGLFYWWSCASQYINSYVLIYCLNNGFFKTGFWWSVISDGHQRAVSFLCICFFVLKLYVLVVRGSNWFIYISAGHINVVLHSPPPCVWQKVNTESSSPEIYQNLLDVLWIFFWYFYYIILLAPFIDMLLNICTLYSVV